METYLSRAALWIHSGLEGKTRSPGVCEGRMLQNQTMHGAEPACMNQEQREQREPHTKSSQQEHTPASWILAQITAEENKNSPSVLSPRYQGVILNSKTRDNMYGSVCSQLVERIFA